MRLTTKIEHGGMILSVTKNPGPRPDNFSELGIPRHPPKSGKFTTDEVPYWNSVDLAVALRSILSTVAHRATSGVTFRLEYRAATARLKNGRVEFAASQDLLFYSKAFDLAGKIYTDLKPIAAARKWAHEFATFWNTKTFGEGYKLGGYIVKIGVALWFNKRHYRENLSSVEWAKRYNKRAKDNKHRSSLRHRKRT
jgi:hypothetical protein